MSVRRIQNPSWHKGFINPCFDDDKADAIVEKIRAAAEEFSDLVAETADDGASALLKNVHEGLTIEVWPWSEDDEAKPSLRIVHNDTIVPGVDLKNCNGAETLVEITDIAEIVVSQLETFATDDESDAADRRECLEAIAAWLESNAAKLRGAI